MENKLTIKEDNRLPIMRYQRALDESVKISTKLYLLLCLLSAVFMGIYWQLSILDFNLFIGCLLATPMGIVLGLAHNWLTPLSLKFDKRKWIISHYRIRMSDGFFIPWSRLHSWSINNFEEIPELYVLSVTNTSSMTRSIIVEEPEVLSKFIDELKNRANQSSEPTCITPVE